MASAYLLSSPSPFNHTPKTQHSSNLQPLKPHSFLSIPSTPTSPTHPKRLHLCKSKKNDETIDAPDRLISAICYFYPLFDGIQYGKYVITQFTPLQLIIQPLVPAIKVFKSFPLNGILVFFTLYFVVVRNQNFSRYVRFNTMQAIVLDILLIFPDLLERSFNPKDGVGLDLMMSLDSTVFLFLLVSLIYGSYSCALGQVPRLPIVAEAAERLNKSWQPGIISNSRYYLPFDNVNWTPFVEIHLKSKQAGFTT